MTPKRLQTLSTFAAEQSHNAVRIAILTLKITDYADSVRAAQSFVWSSG